MSLQRKTTDVKGVESIDVLLWSDHIDDALFFKVARQRELNENAIDLRVRLELVDLGHEVLLRGLSGEFKTSIANADVITSLQLQLDVEFGLWQVADDDMTEDRCTVRRRTLINPFPQRLPYLASQAISIENFITILE